MSLKLLLSLAAAISCSLTAPLGRAQGVHEPEDEAGSTMIVNALLADGTGAPLRKASVRITGDRVARIGDFNPRADDRIIDAKGLVLAPGFIDIHNHSERGIDADPLAETQISQGITTAILGPDGGGPWPVRRWIAERNKNPASLNLATMVGHTSVRELVMGKD